MTIKDQQAIEALYKIKRSKYKEIEITDKLDEILLEEATREIAVASYLNGGRKIRY